MDEDKYDEIFEAAREMGHAATGEGSVFVKGLADLLGSVINLDERGICPEHMIDAALTVAREWNNIVTETKEDSDGNFSE